MTNIKAKALAILAQRKAEVAAKFGQPRQHTEVAVPDLSAIVLGRNELGRPLVLPAKPRLEHAHVIGTTGGGKTNFLEHCIRQDIQSGRGVCVVDPHGNHKDSVYRSLLAWLQEHREKPWLKGRVVHLIDPNAPTHTVGFNPLERRSPDIDLSVIAGTTLEAFERVWGEEDTHSKPTIRRILTATFAALAELGLTLCEAELLFDPHDVHGIRALAARKVQDRYARRILGELHQLSLDDKSKRDFRAEVVGPLNRIAEFVRAKAIRNILGQTERTIDLRASMDEGDVILVNLSGGDRVYETDAELLGRLLTRFLFFHAKRRENYRPFFFYLDECHRYLSGDVERMLAEVRKFGVGVVLSHQWQGQLGKADEPMREAVLNATNLKVVFRVKSVEEAEYLAHTVIPLDLEMPIAKLIQPKVVGSRRVIFASEAHAEHEARGTARAEGTSSSWASTSGSSTVSGSALGDVVSETMGPAGGWMATPELLLTSASASTVASEAQALSQSHSVGGSKSYVTGESIARGQSRISGWTEGLEPEFAPLPGGVHSKENVLYFAAQTLRSLKTGQGFVNFVGQNGMQAALCAVPPVHTTTLSDDAFAALRQRMLEESPSAIAADRAAECVAEREQRLIAEAAEARRPRTPGPKSSRTKAASSAKQDQAREEPKSWRVEAPKRRTKKTHE